MIKAWVFALLLIAENGVAQKQLAAGQGVLKIELNQLPLLHFYQDTLDTAPANSIQISRDSSGEWQIESSTSTSGWLQPEQLFLSYDLLTFRADRPAHSWTKVVTHNETAQTMWVRNARFLVFIPWPAFFLKHASSVEPNERADWKVYAGASQQSKQLRQITAGECFSVKEIKGEWMRVEPNPECPIGSGRFSSGWIRWKQEGRLLITYSSMA